MTKGLYNGKHFLLQVLTGQFLVMTERPNFADLRFPRPDEQQSHSDERAKCHCFVTCPVLTCLLMGKTRSPNFAPVTCFILTGFPDEKIVASFFNPITCLILTRLLMRVAIVTLRYIPCLDSISDEKLVASLSVLSHVLS